MTSLFSKTKFSSLAKAVSVTVMSGAILFGSIVPAQAAGIPDTSSSVDPGPVGDFNWNGANWMKRSWGGGPHFNGLYSTENVINPDANGYVKLNITNPSGTNPIAAEIQTTKKGWGYGTYSTVVEKDLENMAKEIVWGCMFTYDATNTPSHNEIDVCESSAWGGGSNIGQDWPVQQAHGYWIDAYASSGGNVVEQFNVSATNSIQTHRMTWEPNKITYETFAGEGFTGTLLKKTIFEGDSVPEPANEAVHFNFWVTGHNSKYTNLVKADSVTIRDFSFTPLSETSTPTPTPEPTPEPEPITPTIKEKGSVLAIDASGALWNYGNPVGASTRTLVGTGWEGMEDVHVTDWNTDGIQDIIAKAKDGTLYYYEGSSTGGFTRYTIGTGWGQYEINTAYMKKTDTKPGLVARNTVSGSLYYYDNTTGKSLGTRTQIGTGWHVYNNINMLDFDKDGNMDILAKDKKGAIKLHRTNGNAVLISETRQIINKGWPNYSSVSTANNYNGSSNAGLIAKSSDGKLYYYESGTKTWKPRVIIGEYGWANYSVSSS